jgi:hypothetical protein
MSFSTVNTITMSSVVVVVVVWSRLKSTVEKLIDLSSFYVPISILIVICQTMRQLNTQSIQLRESLRFFGSAPDETDIVKDVDNLLAKIQKDARLHHGETDSKRKRPEYVSNLRVPLRQLLPIGFGSAAVTPYLVGGSNSFGVATPLTPRPQETSRRSPCGTKYLFDEWFFLKPGSRVCLACEFGADIDWLIPRMIKRHDYRRFKRHTKEFIEFDSIIANRTTVLLPSFASLDTYPLPLIVQQMQNANEGLYFVLGEDAQIVFLSWADLLKNEFELWDPVEFPTIGRDFNHVIQTVALPSLYIRLELLSKEVRGDLVQTQDLLNAGYRRLARVLLQKQLVRKKAEEQTKLQASPQANLIVKTIQSALDPGVLAAIDEIYKNAFVRHLSNWTQGNAILLNDDDVHAITSKIQQLQPIPDVIGALALTQKNLTPKQQNTDNVNRKKWRAMQNFFATCRVRDNNMLICWAMSNTLAEMSRGTMETALQSQIETGHCVTYITAEKYMRTLIADSQNDIHALLLIEKVITIVFDNFQIIRSKAYQRNTYSSFAVKGTTSFVRRNHQVRLPTGSIVIDVDKKKWTVVESVVIEDAYRFRLSIEDLEDQSTRRIEWPHLDFECVSIPDAEAMPETTDYVDTPLPRSILLTDLDLFDENSIVGSKPIQHAEIHFQA